jgi:hypothetical protein
MPEDTEMTATLGEHQQQQQQQEQQQVAVDEEPAWLPALRKVVDFVATAGASLVSRP